MWLWVVIGLACLLAMVVGSLCVPVHALLDADTEAERKVRVRLTWLFGLIKIGMPAGRRRSGRATPLRLLNWRRFLQSRQELDHLGQIAKDIFSRIKIREVTVRIRFSTGNPLEAGMVMGLVFAIQPLLRLPKEYTIDVKPSFSTKAFFEGRAHFDASARPIRLIGPLARAWWYSRQRGKL